MHAVKPWTTNPPAFELQIDAPSGNREIAHAKSLWVVTTPAAMSTMHSIGCFFSPRELDDEGIPSTKHTHQFR